jgi:hypothetical protein
MEMDLEDVQEREEDASGKASAQGKLKNQDLDEISEKDLNQELQQDA